MMLRGRSPYQPSFSFVFGVCWISVVFLESQRGWVHSWRLIYKLLLWPFLWFCQVFTYLSSSICVHNPREVPFPPNPAWQSPAIFGWSSGLHWTHEVADTRLHLSLPLKCWAPRYLPRSLTRIMNGTTGFCFLKEMLIHITNENNPSRNS